MHFTAPLLTLLSLLPLLPTTSAYRLSMYESHDCNTTSPLNTGSYSYEGPSDNSCSGPITIINSNRTSTDLAFWSVEFQSDVGCMFTAYSDPECKVKEVMTARQEACIDLIYEPVVAFRCGAGKL